MASSVSPNFRRYDPNQDLLLPPSLNDWLPVDRLARFVSEFVDWQIDLALFSEGYDNSEGGNIVFHPGMLLKLWLYGYCIGTPTSRKVARATYDDVAFRWLSQGGHRSICSTPRALLRQCDPMPDTSNTVNHPPRPIMCRPSLAPAPVECPVLRETTSSPFL